jgi:recombination protein RecA
MSKKNSNQEIDLASIADQLNKKFGSNKVIIVGQEPREKAQTMPSGSVALDYALNGGYAEGKIIEIFGSEASGKTTLAIHAMVNMQKSGKVVSFIDMEHAFNFDYAETLGLDVTKLIFSQPDNGEEALRLCEELIGMGVNFVCFDSVAAMIPKAELDGDFGESKMGLHARMMSQGMRKLVGESSKKGATLLFINQTRVKLGVMFGDPTTTTGGEALKFYSSQRLQVLSGSKIKDKDGEIIGQETTVKVIKNKIGSPHKKAKFNIIYGRGIDNLGEVIDIAIAYEVIQKKGSFYSYGEHKLGQGSDALRTTLGDNPELFEQIKKECNL